MKHLGVVLFVSCFVFSARADMGTVFAGSDYRLVEARTNGGIDATMRAGLLADPGQPDTLMISFATMRPDYVSPLGLRACNESFLADVVSTANDQLVLKVKVFSLSCIRDGASAHENSRNAYEGEDRLDLTYHYRIEGTRLYLQPPHYVNGVEVYDDSHLLVFERQVR